MKKGLFFLFIIVFVLTGCSDENITVNKFFSSKIYVSNESISVKGDFTRNSRGEITLKVTSPEDLQGFTYRVSDKNVNMTYREMEAQYKLSDFPKHAPIKIIAQLFDDIESSTKQPKKEGEGYSMKITDYNIKIDDGGNITSAKCNGSEIAFIYNENTSK